MTHDEQIGFQKLTEGLRHAIEGATTLGVYRSDRHWTLIAITLQKTLERCAELRNATAARAAGLMH